LQGIETCHHLTAEQRRGRGRAAFVRHVNHRHHCRGIERFGDEVREAADTEARVGDLDGTLTRESNQIADAVARYRGVHE
jgi:hypothetical protein